MKKKLCSILFLTPILYGDVLSSYNGNTGVFETPNARILNDWSMRFFLNEDKPFRYYGLTASPFPGFEANFHMTQIDGIAGFSDSAGYGDYKDKSLNFKFLLNKETELLPAIAIGADDVWGTALYTSKYIVGSKKISYFDISLGYAKGRLGGEDLRKYSSNTNNSGSFDNDSVNFLKDTDWRGGKPFGSIVFNATPKIRFIGEYSPIDYGKDKVNPFLNGKRYELPKSNFNYGIKYLYSNNSTLSLSYQRGTTLSFGYTYQFSFDRTGMFDHLPDPRWKATEKRKKEYTNYTQDELARNLAKEVSLEKFSNVKTAVNKNKIWTEISNTRYHNDLKAVGRAISTIDEVAPNKYDTIYLTLKTRETPKKTIKINRKEFDLYENEKISNEYMKEAFFVTNNVEEEYEEFSEGSKNI